jgi:hypothetical protein
MSLIISVFVAIEAQGVDLRLSMERSEVFDTKLSAKTISELSKKSVAAGRQDDIVNIEQQVRSIGALAIDEQGGVGARRAKAELIKKCYHALVPRVWCLLHPV